MVNIQFSNPVSQSFKGMDFAIIGMTLDDPERLGKGKVCLDISSLIVAGPGTENAAALLQSVGLYVQVDLEADGLEAHERIKFVPAPYLIKQSRQFTFVDQQGTILPEEAPCNQWLATLDNAERNEIQVSLYALSQALWKIHAEKIVSFAQSAELPTE